MTEQELAVQVMRLVNAMMPLLAGKSAEVQGGALANLVAIHIAGHSHVGDPAAQQLALHIETVRMLIEPNAKMFQRGEHAIND